MYNNITTIIVHNDALESIEEDADFNKHLVAAIRSNAATKNQVNIQAGTHISVATVVEQHPNNTVAVLTVGFNYGNVFGHTLSLIEHDSPEAKLLILRDIAFKMGYFLRKRTDNE